MIEYMTLKFLQDIVVLEKENMPEPKGELAIRTLAMPADVNPAGDIFGGWVISQMDIAGGVTASARASMRLG